MKIKLQSKFLISKALLVLSLFIINLAQSQVYAQENKSQTKIETQTKEVSSTKLSEKTNKIQEKKLTSQNKPVVPTNEKGNNLFATVKKGGPLMFFLIMLYLITATIILERIIFFTKNSIWNGQHLEEILRKRVISTNAIYREDLEDELRKVFSLYSSKMERGLALLSGIGNLAPIVGFLGTVIGMISAFASIAAATTVNAKVVAVGIQIALVTTAGGLIVAAPTLTFFYFFTHVIQKRHEHAEEIISEITEDLPRLSDQLLDENKRLTASE